MLYYTILPQKSQHFIAEEKFGRTVAYVDGKITSNKLEDIGVRRSWLIRSVRKYRLQEIWVFRLVIKRNNRNNAHPLFWGWAFDVCSSVYPNHFIHATIAMNIATAMERTAVVLL